MFIVSNFYMVCSKAKFILFNKSFKKIQEKGGMRSIAVDYNPDEEKCFISINNIYISQSEYTEDIEDLVLLAGSHDLLICGHAIISNNYNFGIGRLEISNGNLDYCDLSWMIKIPNSEIKYMYDTLKPRYPEIAEESDSTVL